MISDHARVVLASLRHLLFATASVLRRRVAESRIVLPSRDSVIELTVIEFEAD
jgi:hypothetical protein